MGSLSSFGFTPATIAMFTCAEHRAAGLSERHSLLLLPNSDVEWRGEHGRAMAT
jgi:hypothetical protein